MFYFIISLFKRKSVSKSTQVRIKIIKIHYFSFTFTLNEKKKAPLKKTWFGERGTRRFCWREQWCLTGGWKLFKKEAWQENSGKNRRRGVNLKETMSQLYIVYLAFALGIIPFCWRLICEGLTHNFENWDYLRTGTAFKDMLKDYFC